MTTYSVLGKPVTREDGPEIVSGQTIYPADIVLPGMIWGKVLRSPFPHARILNIDISKAMALTGVRSVITGKDTAGMKVGRSLRDTPLLAKGKARFVGDRIAAVAADDPDIAEEALTLIDVVYEVLAPVFDPREAMNPEAPIIHEGSPTYDSTDGPFRPQGNLISHDFWEGGDLEKGFAESDLIFEHTFSTPWVHQGYIEPFACVVEIDGAGRVQIWANNKSPYQLRTQIAAAVGMEEGQINVNPCGIGGDFGGKAGAMNVPLAYVLARHSGRPVKMIMNYVEELMAGNPRHPCVVTIKTGVKKDGRFLARHSTSVFNSGAYSGLRGSPNLRGARQVGGGPYKIPNFQIDNYMVYTNTVPCGSYRAPGEPQALWAVESHTDMIAREMGRDPYELRRQNLVHEGDVSATGQLFYQVRAEETLMAAAEAAKWGTPTGRPNYGRGMAIGQRPAAGATSTARLSMDEDAKVTLHSPTPETGVGPNTVGRQLVAEDLGISAEDVILVKLDTDAFPFDSGAGAGTSRNWGHACLGAAQDLRHNLTTMAAEFYGWSEERISFREGRVFVEGDPASGVSIRELAARAVAALDGPIAGQYTFKGDHAVVTSYCAQVAEVEVDPETGQVKVHKIITANDVGTIFNPLGHQGQIDGAVIQGLGYALMEGLEMEEGRISTLSLGEAKIPNSNDIPELITVLVESPAGTGPYQGKGIGENPISPVAPAIAAAIYDAVGVRIQDLPITAEKVLSKLSGKKK